IQPFLRLSVSGQLSYEIGLRLINGTFLAPLALHTVARFPRRRAIPNRVFICSYIVNALVVGIMLLAPQAGLRLAASLLEVVIWSGMLAASLALLFKAAHDPAPAHKRAAQQARLLLMCNILASTPFLIRLLGRAWGFDLPYSFGLAAQIIMPIGV